MATWLLFSTFAVALVIGVPIGPALGGATVAYSLAAGLPLALIPQKMFSGIDSFVLLCVPGFILAGNLMNRGGITEQIMRFSNNATGWVRGGLGIANVTGSMIFAGISGTAVAEAASIGAVMIPGMQRVGYDAAFSAALTASAATMGPIIPPSVPMIIVGTLTGLSVGRMFLAGAVPGLLLGAGMMLACYILARRRNYPRQPWCGFRELLRSFSGAFWALLMTVLILFGIVSGQFTPTEAAVMAALYGFVIGLFVYKGFRLREVPDILIASAVSSASLIMLVGFANAFASILVSERIPQALATALLSFSHNKYVVILLINVLLLIVGMFMETIAALIILIPSLLAVAQQVGIDPVHFATFAVLNLMIGLTTPPVGVCLFVCANIARLSLSEIAAAILPFLLTNIVVLALVSYVPALTLWLPSVFYGP